MRTMLNLEIIKSDLENNLIYLRGSIPGSKNTTVFLRESVKNITKKTINEKYEAKLKNSKLTKQMKGYFAKKNTEPKKILKEFRVENNDQFKEGNELGLEIFKDKKFLDVRSKTIGKGFAGVMKRWNFGGLRASHGVSVSHRSHGSTGQRQDPGKVFKGKKMAGHMGDKMRTMLNLEIIKSDPENGLIYLRGSIPGSKNTTVFLRESVKNITKKTINEKYEAKIKKAEAKKGKK